MNARKILGYALGPIGSAAFGLISLPLISWYFPAEDIGRIVFLQTVAGLVVLLMGLGLDHSYIRFYHDTDNKPALFKSLAITPLLLVSAAAVLIGLWNAAWPSELVFDVDDKTLGAMFLLFLTTVLFSRFLSLILRMQEKAVAFSVSQLIPKFFILTFVLMIVASGHFQNTRGLIFAYTAAQAASTLILAYQTRHELKAAYLTSLQPSLHREGLQYGLPLAFGYLAYWGFTSVDRFILKQSASLEELGIYSMAINFGAVALIFQSVFSTVWAPMVFKWVKDNTNLDKIGDIALIMTACLAAIICTVGIFSPIVTTILPPQYEQVQFILLSSLLFPLLYTLTEVSGIGLNVVKKTWLITLINIICLATNWILLQLSVPHMGAKGAAVSSAVSFCLFFILKTELSSRLWQPLPRRKLYAAALICLAICVSYTCFGTHENYFLFASVWLAGLAGLLLHYKNQLSTAVSAIKGRLKNK